MLIDMGSQSDILSVFRDVCNDIRDMFKHLDISIIENTDISNTFKYISIWIRYVTQIEYAL